MAPRPRRRRVEVDPVLADLLPSCNKSSGRKEIKDQPYPFLIRNLRHAHPRPRSIQEWPALKKLCDGLLGLRQNEEGDPKSQRCHQELFLQLHSARLVLTDTRTVALDMILDFEVIRHDGNGEAKITHKSELSWLPDGSLDCRRICLSRHQLPGDIWWEIKLYDPKRSSRHSGRLENPTFAQPDQVEVQLRSPNTIPVFQVQLERSWKIDPRVPLKAVPTNIVADPSPVQPITYLWCPASGSQQKVVQGWRCPFSSCEELDYGSFERIAFHLDHEHSTMDCRQLTADTVSLWEREPEPDDKEEARRLKLAAMSGRVETGTFADNVSELDDLWHGGEMPSTVYERDEIIFHWGHLPHERRYVMAMWNRWVAEQGPLLVHTSRSYTCRWITRYLPLLVKYKLGPALRDHLMILVGYKLIDSKTALMCMREYKAAKAPKARA